MTLKTLIKLQTKIFKFSVSSERICVKRNSTVLNQKKLGKEFAVRNCNICQNKCRRNARCAVFTCKEEKVRFIHEPKSAKSKQCQLYSKIRVGEIVYPIDATVVTIIGYCTDMEATMTPNTTTTNTLVVSVTTKLPTITIASTVFSNPAEASSTPSG